MLLEVERFYCIQLYYHNNKTMLFFDILDPDADASLFANGHSHGKVKHHEEAEA